MSEWINAGDRSHLTGLCLITEEKYPLWKIQKSKSIVYISNSESSQLNYLICDSIDTVLEEVWLNRISNCRSMSFCLVTISAVWKIKKKKICLLVRFETNHKCFNTIRHRPVAHFACWCEENDPRNQSFSEFMNLSEPLHLSLLIYVKQLFHMTTNTIHIPSSTSPDKE